MTRPKLKHRWRVDFNYLCGMTTGAWLRLLRENRFDVDLTYAHRAAFVTAMSVPNTFFAWVERLRFARRLSAVTEVPPPLFVLGHYRHGTTHLHNLLACDPRLAWPTTWDVTNPHSFLGTGRFATRFLGPLLPKTRPQDSMALAFGLPQEDEYAIGLTTGLSPLLAVNFPRAQERYRRYMTLRDATEAEVDRWKAGLLQFVKKLTLRDGRPVVLKSPNHTGRVRRILELFPDARFVHIHRDPYVVFQSTRHLFDSSIWFMYLQRPSPDGVDERILDWYRELYDAYFEDRDDIPPGRLCEIGFNDLEAAPEETLRRVYSELDLGDFAVAEPTVRRHLDSVAGYRRNRYEPLTEAERAKVASVWARSFQEWGYPV